MNRIKLLLKYFIGNSFYNASSNIKSRNLAIVMYILIIIGISTPIANMIDSMYPNFASIGQEGYLLSIIFLIGSLTLLVLGVYDILDSFFFSQDIEPLMPLPFKSGEIMIGKFITCLVDMYIYLSITIIPLISFGLNAKMGFSYFLMIIPVYLFAPIIIVIFCILITMILMSFINVSKYQNAFKIIFGTLGIVLILGVYSLNSTGLNSENVSVALKNKTALVDLTNKIFITTIFSVKALLYSNSLKGLLNLGLLILISIVALIIAYFLGKSMYKKILSRNLNVYSERKNILENNKNNVVVRSSVRKAMVLRELRTILRDPSNFINCVVMIVYMPIFIFIFFIKGNILAGDTQLAKDTIIMAATFIVTALTISGNSVASTALSREGKEILISKYIPVDYKVQIQSKLIVSFIVNGLALILGIAILIYLKASPLVIVMSLLVQMGTIVAISLWGMILDYLSPKLEWTDTKNLYSKNFKPLLVMLICLVIGGFNIGLIVTKSPIIVFLIDISILLIVSLILYKILMKKGLEAYKRL